MTTTRPPGPRGLPLLGNTHQWARDALGFHEQLAAYGRVGHYEALGQDRYLLSEPEDVERVLVGEADRFRKHQPSTDQLREIVGDGLVTSEGDLWERQREAIQPAFFMNRIKEYTDVMVERAAAARDRLTAGEPVDIRSEMLRTTLEILFDCMFGTDVDLESRGLYDAVDAIQAPLKPDNQAVTLLAPDWLPVPMLRRADRAQDHLRTAVDDILRERRQADDDDREDLLSMLLATGMDDQQIRDEMVTFLIAGHETTALTLTYALHLLADAPSADTHLQTELSDVLEGRPTIEDVFSFEYTEAVVKESMRLYPPAHELRRQPREDVRFGEHTVPEGAMLVLPTWVLHRDDRFWDAPEQFRPDRWLDERDRPEFAYFPFGGGPRHCIGHQFAMTEAQLVLATLAREFTFEREYDELSLSAAVTLQPKTDVLLTPRKR